MSTETLAALQTAIDTHIADESPDNPIPGAWVLLCETTSLDALDDPDSTMTVEAVGSTYAHRGMLWAALNDNPEDN